VTRRTKTLRGDGQNGGDGYVTITEYI